MEELLQEAEREEAAEAVAAEEAARKEAEDIVCAELLVEQCKEALALAEGTKQRQQAEADLQAARDILQVEQEEAEEAAATAAIEREEASQAKALALQFLADADAAVASLAEEHEQRPPPNETEEERCAREDKEDAEEVARWMAREDATRAVATAATKEVTIAVKNATDEGATALHATKLQAAERERLQLVAEMRAADEEQSLIDEFLKEAAPGRDSHDKGAGKASGKTKTSLQATHGGETVGVADKKVNPKFVNKSSEVFDLRYYWNGAMSSKEMLVQPGGSKGPVSSTVGTKWCAFVPNSDDGDRHEWTLSKEHGTRPEYTVAEPMSIGSDLSHAV